MPSRIRIYADGLYLLAELPALVARGLHDDEDARVEVEYDIAQTLGHRISSKRLLVLDPDTGRRMELGTGGVIDFDDGEIFILAGEPSPGMVAHRRHGIVAVKTVCDLLDEYGVEWEWGQVAAKESTEASTSKDAPETTAFRSRPEMQEDIMIRTLVNLGFEPNAIPKGEGKGTSTPAKQKVFEALVGKEIEGVRFTKAIALATWQRLRGDLRIQDA